MKCPRCGSVLNQIQKEGVKIEVCSGCHGEWLHAGELQKIVERHSEVFTPEEIASLDAVNKEIFTAECGGIWTDSEQLKKMEELVDGWKACLNRDAVKYRSILRKIALKEQQELDKTVSISGFSFVNAVLRQFCE